MWTSIDLFAEGVDLVDPVELLQALDGHVQVVADLARIVLRIEGQLAEALVGVLVVALLDGILELLSRRLVVFGRSHHESSQHDSRQCTATEPLSRFHRIISSKMDNYPDDGWGLSTNIGRSGIAETPAGRVLRHPSHGAEYQTQAIDETPTGKVPRDDLSCGARHGRGARFQRAWHAVEHVSNVPGTMESCPTCSFRSPYLASMDSRISAASRTNFGQTVVNSFSSLARWRPSGKLMSQPSRSRHSTEPLLAWKRLANSLICW